MSHITRRDTSHEPLGMELFTVFLIQQAEYVEGWGSIR
jgi:hypothetical protein